MLSAQLSRAFVGGVDDRRGDTRLGHRMAGIGDDLEMGFRPGAMQIPGDARAGHDVVAAMDDRAGDVAQVCGSRKQLAVLAKKP